MSVTVGVLDGVVVILGDAVVVFALETGNVVDFTTVLE
jgi:hypothetical protein